MIVSEILINYLTGNFPYSLEYQTFTMALQGALFVRNGPNKNKTMHWFHAFLQSVVVAFAGALFTPFWLGRSSTVFSNDLNLAMCIVSFILVNYLPGNIGLKLGNLTGTQIVVTAGAQMFRAMGLIKFIHIAHDTFKDSPSSYYPTPVFGPILFGGILGNMGGFFWSGFHGYLEKGMPYAFQNGLFFATFYHFYVNDRHGFIGRYLRRCIANAPKSFLDLNETTFPIVLISGFMQVVAILQLPIFLGPSFNPFTLVSRAFNMRRKHVAPSVGTKQISAAVISTATQNGASAVDTKLKEDVKRNVSFQQTKIATKEDTAKKNKKKKSA